jgi:hypothetical protein
MKRFLTKKKVATTVAVAGLALGAAGVAFAYLPNIGSNTGSAVSNADTGFTVGSPNFIGGPLINGGTGDTITDVIQNTQGRALTLTSLVVSSTGVTESAAGQLAEGAGAPACDTSDYALSAPSGSIWTGLQPEGTVLIGQTATYNTNASIGIDQYIVHALNSPIPGNALPDGVTNALSLVWVNNPGKNQIACEGATVQVQVQAIAQT